MATPAPRMTPSAAPQSPPQQRFFPTPSKQPKKNTPYKSKYGPNPVPETGVGWVVTKQPSRASPALSASIDNKSPSSRNVCTTKNKIEKAKGETCIINIYIYICVCVCVCMYPLLRVRMKGIHDSELLLSI